MIDFTRVHNGYIYKPLEDNATILSVRMTNLEQFYDCPYAYKFGDIKRAEKSKEKYNEGTPHYGLGQTFLQGTILHKATYNYIVTYNILKETTLSEEEMTIQLKALQHNIEKTIMQHRYLYDIESVIKSFRIFIQERGPFKKMNYDSFLSELNMDIMLQFGDLGVQLTGSPDHVFYDENNCMHMLDVKTSKSKRHPVDSEKGKAEYSKRIQRRGYPVLASFFAKQLDCSGPYKFQYFPITKQVTPQITHDFIIPDTTFEKSEKFILKLVSMFVNAYRTNEYEVNPTSKRCFYCPLKKYSLCPHYNEVGF